MFKDDSSYPKSSRDLYAKKYSDYLSSILALKKKVRDIDLREMFPDSDAEVMGSDAIDLDESDGDLEESESGYDLQDPDSEDDDYNDYEYECELREEVDLSDGNSRRALEVFSSLYPDGLDE